MQRGETYSCEDLWPGLRCAHFRLEKDEEMAERGEREITVAPVQEGEKEEEREAGDKMPVEFPQQLLLVDRIPALV